MTLEEQLAEARAELRIRQRLFPRWVAEEKLNQTQADRKIAAMQAICETLQRLIDNEGQQPSLFGGV